MSVEQRFYQYMTPEPNSGCWLWLGSADGHGYPQLRTIEGLRFVSHISLELSGKPRPSKAYCALHRCDFPPCINPDHLYWGSRKQNTADAINRGRLNTDGLSVGHQRMRNIGAARVVKQCAHCGADCTPRNSKLRNNENFFCGPQCSIPWQKQHYTGRPISTWSKAAAA